MTHRIRTATATTLGALALAVAGLVLPASTSAQAPSRQRQGPPPVASVCSQAASFCIGVAPGGSMYVSDHGAPWAGVTPNDLRARAAAHASANGANARAYVVYWSTARQPQGIEGSLRHAGINAVQYLPVSGP